MKRGSLRRAAGMRPLLIAACVAAGLWLLWVGAEMWVEHKVGLMLGRHALHIGDVDVNLLRRSITLHDVELAYNTAQQGRQDMDRPIIRAKIGRVAASGVFLDCSGDRPEIAVGQLRIVSPVLHVDRNVETVLRREDSAARPFVLALVGEVVVSGGRLEYDEWRNGRKVSWRVLGLDLHLSDLDADSLLGGRTAWRRAVASADSVDYTFDGGATMLSLGGLKLDTGTGRLSADSLRLSPQRWGKDEYAQNTEGHPDWTSVAVGGVRCEGVDFAGLSAGTVRMDSLVAASARVESYKNRKVSVEPKRKELFYVSLQRLPVRLDIGGTRLSDVDVVYEELALGGLVPGRLSITGIDARLGRVTNTAGPSAGDLELSAEGRLEGSGQLSVEARFPSDPAGNFSIVGRAGRMDLRALNPTIGPLMNVEIVSGVMDRMDFRITGDSVSARSEVEFLYRDLAVAVYKLRDGQARERKLLNGIVDNVVLRKDNPGRNGRVRRGSGAFERDPYRSQFNYFYKAVVQGIAKVVTAL